VNVGEEFEDSDGNPKPKSAMVDANMHCDWCKNAIESGARVCAKCGRHQGLIGWFSIAGVVVGVVVAVLGALLSVYSANQAQTERVQAETALAEAREARQEAINAVEVGHQNYVSGLRASHKQGALNAAIMYRALCKDDTLNTESCHRLYGLALTMTTLVQTSDISGGAEATVDWIDKCLVFQFAVDLEKPPELNDCKVCEKLESIVPDLLTSIQTEFDAECPVDNADDNDDA